MSEDGTFFKVRAAYRENWQDAMKLAWDTFLQFEAPIYPPEGSRSFHDFVTDETLHRMFLTGSYQMFVALEGERIIGMITLRMDGHISLLFVDGAYHRRGVGRALIQCVEDYLLSEMGLMRMTVNASPYGEEFYKKLGFTATSEQAENDGIIYTPMELVL